MRTRIWNELCQVKHNQYYCTFLLGRQKRLLNYFNIMILVFSSGGVMGFSLWKTFPLLSCFIISFFQILRLIQSNLVPSEKQIEKLEQVVNFYFDHFNLLEQQWFDCYHNRCNEQELQEKFFKLKSTEKEINIKLNEIVKRSIKAIRMKATEETANYLHQTYNIQT